MNEKNFEPELNEEIFDIVDSALEEEFEKYDIPKRLKYELMMAINKNMEKKFENTRVEVTHIKGPIGPVKKETASLAKAKPENLVYAGGTIKGDVAGENRVFGAKEMLERRQKVEDSTRMNEDVQPVGYQPELAEDMTNKFGFENESITKVEDSTKMNEDVQPVGYQPELDNNTSSAFEFGNDSYSINTSTSKVDDTVRFNIDEEPVGYTPQFDEKLLNQIEELKQLKSEISETPEDIYADETIKKY